MSTAVVAPGLSAYPRRWAAIHPREYFRTDNVAGAI
jgi:hypothetical protein